MAERLHPGVYVEEKRRGTAPIQGVSTSTFGIVGFTERGPTDKATLVTSFDQFSRIFGGFTDKSGVPLALFSFFANGGRRALVVRVVPSDATLATGFVANPVEEEVLVVSNGTTSIAGTLDNVPVRPSTVTVRWRVPGTAVTGAAANPNPTPNGTAVDFAGRIVVSGNARIVNGSVTITTTVGGNPVTYTDSAADGTLRDSANHVRGYIDYITGAWNLSVATGQEPDNATSITANYTPEGALVTSTDDGLGNMVIGSTTVGTVNYATGAVSITAPSAVATGHRVLANYTQNAWPVSAISRGAWGNDLRIVVRGNADAFNRVTATYSRFDVLVYIDTELFERYEGLSLTSTTDPKYLLTIINDQLTGSDLVVFTDPPNASVAPAHLSGIAVTRSGGAGNGSNKDYGSNTVPLSFRTAVLRTPVQPGSVNITYTDASGASRTVTDDGNGNLVGDVDTTAPAAYNKVNYTTGEWLVRFSQPVSEAETSNGTPPTGNRPGSLITVNHRLRPSADESTNLFSGGSDGTAVTRSELTAPALKPSRQGMYALLAVDELINLGIPDATGSVAMAVDQVAEAESNGKWFVILAAPAGMTPEQVRDWRKFTLGITSSYAALYYPHVLVKDPVDGTTLTIPPIGHVAGVYARTDINKNVAKAPAGTDDGRLLYTVGLERRLEFGDIDVFFQSQVNALIDTPQTGRVVWGARTLESPPGDFRYVQVRRLFNFLRKSIFDGTHGFVFESVGATLRQRIQLSVESFLRNLFNQGYFAGSQFTDAVAVVCDESNNPPEVEEAGEVICDVYIAPNKPGEFIVFRLQQKIPTTS